MYQINRIEIQNDDTHKIIHSVPCKMTIHKKDEKGLKQSIKNNFVTKCENLYVIFHKKDLTKQ